MRDRLPADWTKDLANRRALEAQVEAALRCRPELELLASSTNAYDRLDFQLRARDAQLVELELKAKLQPLSSGWTALRPEVDPADLFVLDELALRKVIDVGRFGFLLVRDLPRGRWALWSAGDLLLSSKVRTSRVLHKSARPVLKGKLLLDLSEAAFVGERLAPTLDALCELTGRLDSWWNDVSPWPRIGTASR